MYKLISTMKFRPILSSAAITAILLLCVVVAGCSRPSDAPAWPATDIEWPLDHTGIPKIKLHVPPGYNSGARGSYLEKQVYPQGRPKDPNNVREVLLLETLWPEMEPRLRRNNEEFRAPGGGRVLGIFMESGAFDPKKYPNGLLHRHLNVDIDNLKRVCITPPRVTERAKCHHLSELDEKPAKFGLKRIGVDFSKLPDVPKSEYRTYNDIYYAPDLGGTLQTYISCTAEEMGPQVDGHPYIPHCDQRFIFKPLNALVTVNYRRVYLEDWRVIQAAVEKLLQSFIVQQ